jgi:hypothetical protein
MSGVNSFSASLPFFLPVLPTYDLGTKADDDMHSLDDVIAFKILHHNTHIMTGCFSLGTRTWSLGLMKEIFFALNFAVYSRTEQEATALGAVLSQLVLFQRCVVKTVFKL